MSSTASTSYSEENVSYLTTIAAAFAIAISAIAIVLRLLARKLHGTPLASDDYTIALGALFTIGNATAWLYANREGNGRHQDTLTREELAGLYKAYYISYQLYGLAITAIKISVLLFYRRLFSTQKLRVRINFVATVVVAWLLVNNLLSAFQCAPLQRAWRFELPGHCINALTWIVAVQILNVVIDLMILALPLSIVLRLHMSTANKIGVAGIFLLGSGSIVIAIVRLAYLAQSLGELDRSYGMVNPQLTVIEPAIEVFSACLPVMACFLQIHAQLTQLWSRLGSLFSPRQSSAAHRDQDQEGEGAKGRRCDSFSCRYDPQSRPKVTVTTQKSALGSDQIPLHSIMVCRDLDWEEERGMYAESNKGPQSEAKIV